VGSGDEESYVKVSEMFRAIRTTNDEFGESDRLNELDFNCYNDAGDSPLTIHTGDIIGACVFDPPGGSTRELDIVGQVSGESLLQAGISSDDCTMNDILSIIQSGDLQPRNDRRLHIYANIEPGKIIITAIVHEVS
jgi:hypothetical protein